jgi:FAD-linked sulfhydryl oxidase
MAEVKPERADAQYRGTGNVFSQQPSAAASSFKQARDDDSKAPLPKGVVLDKDGKP